MKKYSKLLIIVLLLVCVSWCLGGYNSVSAKTKMYLISKVTKKYVKCYDWKVNYSTRVFKPKGKLKKIKLAKGVKFKLIKNSASLNNQVTKRVSKTKFKQAMKWYSKDKSGYYYYMLADVKIKNNKVVKISERMQDF